ncbi:hypothetical protein BX661DRAFT_184123 [Kickxella alabastrina]|uniref:uncharacterized protein n=1 Tax=Kickxella alabastrina TaxID=61397 RepID=UPI0022210762|nr:uncharacterized protein BX661DRAFT_184123 [Kickxella alabastrina]KAI7825770.1 hypothetical protein BX661DRAFT_184123 [Kickxella alabastrina]
MSYDSTQGDTTPFASNRRRQQDSYRHPRGPPPFPPGILATPLPIINPFGPPAPQKLESDNRNPAALEPTTRSRFEAQQLVIAYIGGISSIVDDEWVEKVLRACGRVKSWRRARDADEQPLSFGFCEFESMKDAACALRVLSSDGGLKKGGWVLPSATVAGKPELLSIKIDNRMLVDLRSHAALTDGQEQRRKKTNLLQCNYELEAGSEGGSADTLLTHPRMGVGSADEAHSTLKPRKTSEPESSANFSSGSGSVGEATASDNQQPFLLELEEAWEREQVRQHRDQRYIVAATEREHKLGGEQVDREGRIERNALRELDRIDDRQRARDAMSALLPKWDDSYEESMRDHDYYRDHERWWHHRKTVRTKELSFDEDDRRRQEKEQQDREQEQDKPRKYRRTSEEENVCLQSLEAASTSPDIDMPTLNLANDNVLQTSVQSSEAPETLLHGVPMSRNVLFEWPVKWELVDDTLIQVTIAPAVRKQLSNYLGAETDDGSVDELADFVIAHIAEHKPPASLAEELEMVLVDDSAVFVTQLWRLLVSETESRT